MLNAECCGLLHLVDVLVCIVLLQLSQIQTSVFVGPGLVSTSPAFVRSRANHIAGSCGCLAQKSVNRVPIAGTGVVNAVCAKGCQIPP